MDENSPIVDLLMGLQASQIAIFNALIDSGHIDRDQAVKALKGATQNMNTELHEGLAGTLVKQIITGVEHHHPPSPEDLRRSFRVLDGARGESDPATRHQRRSPESDDDGDGGGDSAN